MKIAFFCDEYPSLHSHSGGIGTFTQVVARALAEKGDEVLVIGFGPVHLKKEDGDVRLVILKESRVPRLAWLLNRLKLWCFVQRLAQKGQIDILEIPDWCGILPLPTPFVPVIVRLHNPVFPPSRVVSMLEKLTLFWHRDWIAVSAWQGQNVQKKYGLKPRRMAIIYCPVEPQAAKDAGYLEGIPTKYVLYAGAVSARKGALVTAYAAREFLAADRELHLVYAGSIGTEDGEPLDQRIREIVGDGLVPRVHFTGFVPRDVLLSLMRKAEVFVFPSRAESLGLVVLEAMAMGTPVVYSRCHVGPEVVDHGVTGLLADPQDPADVAEKVKALLIDREAAKQMGLDAQQAVLEKFSVDRCVLETLNFYGLVRSRSGRCKRDAKTLPGR
ncbi:MAG: glycosyltransferase family 4 protein [Candidatus Hadarchaeum sp.]